MTPEIRDTDRLTKYAPPLLKPRNRKRWAIYITLNATMFLVACLFWRYLRTGDFFALTTGTLQESFSPSMDRPLLDPLSVFISPWQFMVIGLVLTVLIAVPLTVAVMYQLLLAICFVLGVGVVADMPLLAMSLAAGCVLAARTTLRRDYPAFAIMIGMIPVCVYFYFAYQATDSSLLEPIERWVIFLPIAGSVLLTILAAEVAVFMARLRKFQPGVVWPTLLLVPAGIAIFFSLVGDSQMQYARINQMFTGPASLNAPADEKYWLTEDIDPRDRFHISENVSENFQLRKANLIKQCKSFTQRYSKKDLTPAVLWVLAEAKSTQLNRNMLERGIVSPSSKFVLQSSEKNWLELAKRYPQSNQAVLAEFNLAKLRAQNAWHNRNPEKQIARALKTLQAVEKKLRYIVSPQGRLDEVDRIKNRESIFRAQLLHPQLISYQQALSQSVTLIWYIKNNQANLNSDDAFALSKLLNINPCQSNYYKVLTVLAKDPQTKSTKIAGNIALRLAEANPIFANKITALKTVAKEASSDTDAAIEANYILGAMSLQISKRNRKKFKLKSPAYYFKIVLAARENPWQSVAKQLLGTAEN